MCTPTMCMSALQGSQLSKVDFAHELAGMRDDAIRNSTIIIIIIVIIGITIITSVTIIIIVIPVISFIYFCYCRYDYYLWPS